MEPLCTVTLIIELVIQVFLTVLILSCGMFIPCNLEDFRVVTKILLNYDFFRMSNSANTH